MAEGALSAGMSKERIFHFPDSEAAAREIGALVKEGDLILVKGSRGMKMDKVVDELRSKG